MKKIFLYVTIAAMVTTIVSCHPKLTSQKTVANQLSFDSKGNPMLLGISTKEKLEAAPYGEWFNKNYSDYRLDSGIAEKIKPNLSGKNFVIFMGTWCGDSRREVPRMFKLLDYCGIQSSKIQLVMVNVYDSVYKQSPTHEERGFNIHRVPDLLVFDGKKEIGRIVESPVISLEQDLFDIIEKKKYAPKYRIVPYLVNLFGQKSVVEIQNDLENIASSTRPLMIHVAELRSYGHVLMAAGETDKALIVFELNALLYPDNAGVFDNLGEYYFKTGNSILAKANFQKSLQLQPGNEDTKKMLEKLP